MSVFCFQRHFRLKPEATCAYLDLGCGWRTPDPDRRPSATRRRQSPVLDIRDRPIRLRPSVSVKLPGVAHLLDQPEIEIGDDEFVLVATGNRDELTARIAEVTLSVELADVPRLLHTDAIDRTDEISVRHRMRGLLQFPQILG